MKGKNWRIGIVNKDGESVDVAGLSIEVWHTAIPNEVTSLDGELPIPEEHVAGFIKGVAYELLLMSGAKAPTITADMEETSLVFPLRRWLSSQGLFSTSHRANIKIHRLNADIEIRRGKDAYGMTP